MEVLIPFAKLTASGRIVSVDEVPRGNACNCSCIFCDVPMQARKGGVKQEHFAHQARLVEEEHCCQPSFERSLFWMARRLLSESNEIELPSYSLFLADWAQITHSEQVITISRRLHYDTVEFPEKIETPKHDVAIITVGDYKLAVTLDFGIAHSRGAYHYQEQKLAHLVIEMDKFRPLFRQHKAGFRSLMEAHLIDSILEKHWVYHPNEEALIEAHKLEVDAAIAKQTDLQELQQKAFLEEHLKKPKPPPLIPRVTPAYIPQPLEKKLNPKMTQQRLDLLVANVERLKQKRLEHGYVCDCCKVMRAPEKEICTYCNSPDYTVVELSNSYMANLQKKYWCWNYAEKSLEALLELAVISH